MAKGRPKKKTMPHGWKNTCRDPEETKWILSSKNVKQISGNSSRCGWNGRQSSDYAGPYKLREGFWTSHQEQWERRSDNHICILKIPLWLLGRECIRGKQEGDRLWGKYNTTGGRWLGKLQLRWRSGCIQDLLMMYISE